MFVLIARPPRSPLFPYTTLFRSLRPRGRGGARRGPARTLRARLSPQRALVARRRPSRARRPRPQPDRGGSRRDRKSTRLNSSHTVISYAVFCLKKKPQVAAIRSV